MKLLTRTTRLRAIILWACCLAMLLTTANGQILCLGCSCENEAVRENPSCCSTCEPKPVKSCCNCHTPVPQTLLADEATCFVLECNDCGCVDVQLNTTTLQISFNTDQQDDSAVPVCPVFQVNLLKVSPPPIFEVLRPPSHEGILSTVVLII